MNRATLIGRVGRDPESRTFPSGDKVVSFSLATSESWRDKATGERKDKTEWHNISVFNENIGKVAASYVKKGSRIAIEGAIQYRKFTDKDGNERTATEIVIPKFGGSLELLDSKPTGDTEAPRSGGGNVSPDDDIPF